MAKAETSNDVPRSRPRRKFRRWLLLAALIGALAWLNGPGLRWIAPAVASHFLRKAGLQGSFTVHGSLTGGFALKDLQLTSDGTLASLSADRAKPLYRFSELLRGRISGIEIDGAHVGLRFTEPAPEKEMEIPDLEKIVQRIRQARGTVIPLSIRLSDFTLSATRDERQVFALGKSSLEHAAGKADFNLSLGPLTDTAGRIWPSRNSTITWNENELLLDRLNPLPGIALRALTLSLPETGGPAADAELLLGDAVFVLTAAPGFSSIGLDLREGRLDMTSPLLQFALKLPVTGVLTSLSLNIDDVLPDPSKASGSARLLLENIGAKSWTIPELNMDLGLEPGRATLAASGRAFDTGFSINADAPVTRDDGKLMPGEIRGKFHVEDVAILTTSLAPRIQAIDPQAALPPSTAEGTFNMAMENWHPSSASLELDVQPLDPEKVSPIALKASWQDPGSLSTELALDGLRATADYDLMESRYHAKAVFNEFTSARIDPWLEIFKAETRGAYLLTGNWECSGEINNRIHRGECTMEPFRIIRDEMPPVQVRGAATYNWPAGFSTKNLTVKTGDQSVAADIRLAEGLLELKDFLWRQNDREIASGSAVLPAPQDFTRWRETLALDTRPLKVNMESAILPLDLLQNWLPAASKIDSKSTGKVSLKISGSYAAPEVDAVLEARDLRSPENPKLPPADLRVRVSAKDGRLLLDGNATAPDLPAAVLVASMPFRPAEWVENPDSILDEPLTARADLPRLDLARYASLIPAARRLGGMLTGRIEAAGSLGDPAIKGMLELKDGMVELNQGRAPALTGITATADLSLEGVVLRELRADIAGGSLRGEGSMKWMGGKPGDMDFRLIGRHLPVMRNDSMIVRTHTDLRLAGAYETAALSGTVSVVNSLFYRDIEILPIGVPFTTPRAAALPRIDPPPNPASRLPEPFASWTLDVRVRTEEPFLIRGNFASGMIAGEVRLRGTIGNPLPDGEVSIRDLRAALPFSTLTVKSGSLRFTPETGFDPMLEIRGTSNPRPYRVNGYIYGRASDPELVLTSTPPLPPNEIMTLLATGTTTTGLENPQAASSRAMQLFAEELRRGRFGVGRQLRPLLGLLDRVDFTIAEPDPYSSESYSTATLAITDRWFLSAGMGEEGDSRFLAIWRLVFH